MTQDKEIIEVLEQLNVTLGSIRDVLNQVGTDDGIEREISRLEETAIEYRKILENHDQAGRLVRMNRELREQIKLIRDIVEDSYSVADEVDKA